jgi:uncharacterized protein YbjT (DUF2867 family)
MKILVIGGTGLIGSQVVARLQRQGHTVVPAAPSTGVDVLSGEGLDLAMAGASVVVDLANSPSLADDAAMAFFRTAGRNVLAAGARAGITHHLALSVVGTERLQASGYFRAKLEQERLVRRSGLRHTIVHSTQFHEFVPRIVDAAADGDAVRLSPALVQPIASEDVAEAVSRLALQPPADSVVEIAGPERLPLVELARRLMRFTGDTRALVSDPGAPYFGATLAAETLVPGHGAWLGTRPFQEWLEGSRMGATRPRQARQAPPHPSRTGDPRWQ